jgi:hypothetical protein
MHHELANDPAVRGRCLRKPEPVERAGLRVERASAHDLRIWQALRYSLIATLLTGVAPDGGQVRNHQVAMRATGGTTPSNAFAASGRLADVVHAGVRRSDWHCAASIDERASTG